jgi:hypothetical protein
LNSRSAPLSKLDLKMMQGIQVEFVKLLFQSKEPVAVSSFKLKRRASEQKKEYSLCYWFSLELREVQQESHKVMLIFSSRVSGINHFYSEPTIVLN